MRAIRPAAIVLFCVLAMTIGSPRPLAQDTEPAPLIGGLRLEIGADKDELQMTPIEGPKGIEGYKVEPAKLNFTFTNVGKHRIKVIAYDIGWSMIKLDVKGPDGKSVTVTQKADDREPREPRDKDFPQIDPSRSWTAPWQPRFPGAVGGTVYKLLKPGTYRIRATYTCTENLLRLSDLSEGSWVGKLKSNELTLKLVVAAKEGPKTPGVVEPEPVNGLKLTLSLDKPTVRLTPREARPAGDDQPRYDTEPVQLSLTFTNVSDKPVKLNAYDITWALLKLDIRGPGDKSVVASKRLIDREQIPPTEKDYITIKPKGKFTHDFEMRFPGGGMSMTYALQQQGDYVIKATYENPEPAAATKLKPFQEDCWTGSVASNEVVLKASEKGADTAEPDVAPNAAGAPLRLELVADHPEVQLKLQPAPGPDGQPRYTAIPVKLTVNFGNVGDKPLKLYAHQVGRLVKLNVKGPDADSVRETKGDVKMVVSSPRVQDYPSLDPNMQWTSETPQDFPGLFGMTVYAITKPGEYKVSVTYTCTADDLKRSPLAAGCWIGTSTSEEIVIKATADEGK